MQMLIEEMGIGDTVDPLGGSYYIESLTNEMESRIVAEMKRVENEWGGIVKAVSEGIVQGEVAHQAFGYEKGIQDGSIPKVGVNRYRMEEEKREVALHNYNPAEAEDAIRRTAEMIAQRDSNAVKAALEKIRIVASSDQNIMPALVEAVRAYATIGEITGVMKDVFGKFSEPVNL
jgi:methylmalonyl-CoA mutase N-terminal domain/subunit